MIALLRTEFGVNAATLQPLSGGRVNRLWRCGDWVVKVYDHRQVPRERAERAIQLQERAGDALWAQSDAGMVVVMPFMRGLRRVRGRLSRAESANFGSLLGSLHEMLRSVSLEGSARPTHPSSDTVAGRWEHLKNQALCVATPTDFDKLVVEVAEYASASLLRMPQVDWHAQPWQICHGDLHLDNVLFDDDGRVVGVLDFDNAAPSWSQVELMMAWNLCLCSDPGEPSLTPEAATEYKKANCFSGDFALGLLSYWYTLIANTWPATIRYREGAMYKAEWVEMLSMRYRAARWLEENSIVVTEWFESET